MIAKLRLVFSITIAFLSFYGVAQTKYWKSAELGNADKQITLKKLDIAKAKAFVLNETAFKERLKSLSTSKYKRGIVSFPDENGEEKAYNVVESNVFSPELAEKYPDIKSYKGTAVDDKSRTIAFSVSPKGIQTMVIDSKKKGTVFMEKGKSGAYIVYNSKDRLSGKISFICKTNPEIEEIQSASTAKLVDDQSLRKFRVAIAASGEYTEYHGGTKADALAAINATLTRVNAVFERDIGVTLELIGDTDQVIYTDPDTDPFTGGLSSQAQSTLTSVIGEENYDIGHLFNQQDNALDGNSGFIGSVCVDNRKGSAYTTFSTPEGDEFDIDLVAHEMGHQFGANHTFSHISESTTVQVEPGSGTTIMGYAGITGANNVAYHSDDYFHYVSIVQIRDYLETISCGEVIPLTNNPPSLDPVEDYVIPVGTPFVLTGSATDPDVGDVLSYTWEQIDNGIVTQATFGPNSPTGALFRSLPPKSVPERYFPDMSRVVEGNLTQTSPSVGDAWETLSNVERNLNFSLTVRDNALGGGQLVSDELEVFVTDDAGPFVVTSQDVASSFVAGEVETISWDVANTDMAPVSAETVDIYLSTDGGLTYPTLVAENVENDGSYDIVIPGGQETTTGRFMVKASDNIFFAINAADFSITESSVVLDFDDLSYNVCKPDDLVVNFEYKTYLGFSEESTLSVDSLPTGLTAVFSQDTVSDSDTNITITFSGTTNLAIGNYLINVVATSDSLTKTVPLELNIYDTSFSEVVLTAPADGVVDVSKDVLLEWDPDISSTEYDVEIATDAAFSSVVETATVSTNTYTTSSLLNDTQYFWRVKPKNDCGEGVFGTAFSFTTIQFNCKTKSADNLPVEISSIGTPTITSKVVFYQDLALADINVNLEVDHTYLADLVISLTSPAGTTVVLVSSSCGDSSDINAIFDDDASADFECSGTPAISGTVRPLGLLSSFNGESILGEWTLEIQDNAASDGGSLTAFSLEVCVEGDFRPDEDEDGVFDDGEDLCLDTPLGQEVDATGCPIYRFSQENFTVTLESETCSSNDDGVIRISPKVFLDYEVTVTGNGVDLVDNFTNDFVLTGLSAGTYEVCINGTDGTIVYEPFCLEAVITEPEPLSVTSQVSLEESQLTVSLEGSEYYYIELNNDVTYTESSEVSLDLKEGVNVLKVYTDIACQGVYEEQFVVSGGPVIVPNPFTDIVEVYFTEQKDEVAIAVYSANGRLVKSEVSQVNGVKMSIDLSQLATGLYYVQLNSNGVIETTKIIKK